MDWARAQVVKVMNFSGSELNVFQPLSDQFMKYLMESKKSDSHNESYNNY